METNTCIGLFPLCFQIIEHFLWWLSINVKLLYIIFFHSLHLINLLLAIETNFWPLQLSGLTNWCHYHSHSIATNTLCVCLYFYICIHFDTFILLVLLTAITVNCDCILYKWKFFVAAFFACLSIPDNLVHLGNVNVYKKIKII